MPVLDIDPLAIEVTNDLNSEAENQQDDNNSGWTMETKLFQEKVVISSLDTREKLATIEKVVIESNWPDANGENETLLNTLEHMV